MIKIFDLSDPNFFDLLTKEGKEEFKIISEALENNYTPCVKIVSTGHRSSWYNKHQGKTYILYKLLLDTNHGYVNFIVRSNGDGTKKGYSPQFSSIEFGPGYDIVHYIAGELCVGVTESNLKKHKS